MSVMWAGGEEVMGQKEKDELARRFKELVEKGEDFDVDSDGCINLSMDMIREGTQDLELSVTEEDLDKINRSTHAILTAMQALRISYKLPPLFFS